MALSFRVAEKADTDMLVAFMRALYAFDHLPFDENIARAALEGILRDHSFGYVWLIQVDGAAIGYVVLTLGYSLEYHGRDAFIDELYIRESHRGHGIGSKTLQFVEDACRALGVQALHLEVERTNTGAQTVYRKAGFVDHDRYLLTKWIGERSADRRS